MKQRVLGFRSACHEGDSEALVTIVVTFHMSHMMASASDIPDEQTFSRASDLTIYDSKGEGVKFGSLFEKDKTLVVFVRTSNSNDRVQFKSQFFPVRSFYLRCMYDISYCTWLLQTPRILVLPGEESPPICAFIFNPRQAYVSQLAEVPQSVLDTSNVKIVVIGCGQWEPISRYSGTYVLKYTDVEISSTAL